ncbi:mitochondral 37S ribosomal protein S27 [Umbelopsis sp. WA50703]
MSAPPSPARLAKLTQTVCKLFDTVYNPMAVRSGNKILRERLVGPSVSSYYPQPLIHFRDIKAAVPQLKLIDMDEKERLDEIARRKRRGKGAPKKGQGKRASIKKK